MTVRDPAQPLRAVATVLPNGVSLLNAPSASRNVGVFLIVRAGSRDETAETSGLAHYLEHMFFKGTARRPTTLQISREIDRLGANTNAYTDTEEVAYYAEGPATALDELTDIITDMLTRPLFAAEEVERERNVVLQELSARLSDPEGWIWDRLGTVAFGGDQPMAWSAAGFPSVIEKASRDQLLDYHGSFYAPESMCLTIAGGASLTPERAAELLADVPTRQPAAPRPGGVGTGRALHLQRAPGHRPGGAADPPGVRGAGHPGHRRGPHRALGHDPHPRRRHVVAALPHRARAQRALLQHLLPPRGLRGHRRLRDQHRHAAQGRAQGHRAVVRRVPRARRRPSSPRTSCRPPSRR